MKTVHYNGNDFKVFHCGVCQCDAILCVKCGNNTCNGGQGLVDGEPCDLCEDAWGASKVLWGAS